MNLDTFLENRKHMQKTIAKNVDKMFGEEGCKIEIELGNPVNFEDIKIFRVFVDADYLYGWSATVETKNINAQDLIPLATLTIREDYFNGYKQEIADALEECNNVSLREIKKVAEYVEKLTGI